MDDLLENLDTENLAAVNLDEYFTNQEKLSGVPCGTFQEVFALENKSFNDEDRTIKVRYTNNNKVLRYSWVRGEYFYLQLSSKPGAVDLGRLNNGASVLDSHNQWSLKNVLGAVVPGSATEKEAVIKFSARDDVKPIVQDVKDGILRFVSPGLNIIETKDITKEGEKLRTLLVTKWEPYEISFCATPADPEAQALALKQEVEAKLQGSKQAEKKEQKKMDEEQLKAASAAATAEKLESAKAEAASKAKLEASERATAIFEIAEKTKLGLEFAKEMIESEKTIEQVQKFAIDKLADLSKEADDQIKSGVNFTGTITGGEDLQKLGMIKALEGRVGLEKIESGNRFNNMSLSEMAKESVRNRGGKVDFMSKSEIAELAMHSTSDFPNILANVASKQLRKAYQESNARDYQKFCNKVTLTDFKPVSSVQISEIPTPTKVTEGGEFQQTTLSDGKETYQLATYGEIISITRQTIINDDLRVLTRIPKQIGSSFARLEADLVYAILTANGNMADGNALFSVAHANLTDALLLENHASLNYYGMFTKMFRKQTGPKGVANLNLYPKYLIVGPDQEAAARRLLQPVAAVEASKVNLYSGSSELIVEPRISGNAYYGVADPNTIDTIDYGYLEGAEGPQIFTREGFRVDGVEIKARLDFVAAAVEWRGMGKSTNDDS